MQTTDKKFLYTIAKGEEVYYMKTGGVLSDVIFLAFIPARKTAREAFEEAGVNATGVRLGSVSEENRCLISDVDMKEMKIVKESVLFTKNKFDTYDVLEDKMIREGSRLNKLTVRNEKNAPVIGRGGVKIEAKIAPRSGVIFRAKVECPKWNECDDCVTKRDVCCDYAYSYAKGNTFVTIREDNL